MIFEVVADQPHPVRFFSISLCGKELVDPRKVRKAEIRERIEPGAITAAHIKNTRSESKVRDRRDPRLAAATQTTDKVGGARIAVGLADQVGRDNAL